MKPDKINDFTGYRYYNEEQLLVMGKINALKDMGFGVTAIAEIMKYDSIIKLMPERYVEPDNNLCERKVRILKGKINQAV